MMPNHPLNIKTLNIQANVHQCVFLLTYIFIEYKTIKMFKKEKR